jgi:hypothetical protein
MRVLCLVLLLALPASADALDDLLERAGMRRADLGFRPKGYWVRFPHEAPHRLRHFDDLFAEPLATVTFSRVLGRAARDYLAPDALQKRPEADDGALYKLAWSLGVDRRFGGFRAYSANLVAEPAPLHAAILELHRAAGRATRFVSFGKESPYPLLERDLERAASVVPEAHARVLGRLIREIVEARRWVDLAFRKVPLEERVAASDRIDAGAESVDALEYPHVFDDVARSWDEASLWYASLRCVQALDEARQDLAALPPPPSFAFDWRTPFGWIRIRGSGDDAIDGAEALLVVDLGGNDRHAGAATAHATHPIALALDLSGDDVWEGGGGARCGVAVLLDAAGDDAYAAEDYAQGAGQFGFGALFDLAGRDTYRARYSSQGCGYFGIGLLADAAGDDRYAIAADGQGFGGVGGVGALADRAGNDVYFAEPDPERSGRPSYHSEGKVSVSNAQGCAMGRRGDGADGHSWSGGLGLLLDVEGDDSYLAGNWCHGTGYWFGTGILWDGGGNDAYRGAVWSQATGAHFCIGALVDEGGDDTHVATQNNSIAFAHDFTAALLVDLGGNDRYEIDPAGGGGLGYSINRSVAMLVDVGGDDAYAGRPGNVPGFALFDRRLADRSGLSTYFAEATSLGLFLDVGGTDRYWTGATDGAAWGDAPGSDNWRARNVGVGADVAEGEVTW